MWTRFARFSMYAVVAVTVTLLFASCSPSPSNSPQPSQPKFGGTVVDGISGDPNSLMPNEPGGDPNSSMVDAAIWAPLLYGDDTYHIQPGLATEVPSVANGGISSDFKTFTIHLRQGLKWSDGSPETAQDVVFSFKLFGNPAYPTTSGFPGSEITSIRAVDTTTVVITLNRVDVSFFGYLVDPPAAPIPESVFGSMDPASVSKSAAAHQPPIDSGPFVIKERVDGDHITVVKNPHYYLAPKPYLDSVRFSVLPDKNSRITALQSGAIDSAWNLDIEQYDALKAIPNYRVAVDKSIAQQEMLWFNFQNPFLKDIAVRKAITMSIDLTPLMTDIWRGLAQPTCDDSTGNWAHEPSLVPCYKYEPSAARSLLESDGFSLGTDGYFTKGGKRLELRWSATSDQGFRVRSETLEQDQLKSVGIKMDVDNYPPSTLYGSIETSGNFDVIEDYYGAPYDPDEHILWDCNQVPDNGGFNIIHWCDPVVDQADAQQLSTFDQSTRLAAFHIIHRELLAQVPVMFLYGFPNIACVTRSLQNYSPMEAGPPETWNIWNWWRSDAPGK